MDTRQSQNRSEFQKELEKTTHLKNIKKGKTLQAPEGYFNELDQRLFQRIAESESRVPTAPIFTLTPLIRRASIAAAIGLFVLGLYISRNQLPDQTAGQSKPKDTENSETFESELIESTEMQAIGEHVLAEELMSGPLSPKTEASGSHEELTEYLLMHADQDLLIESL